MRGVDLGNLHQIYGTEFCYMFLVSPARWWWLAEPEGSENKA